ncbi:MAG: O-antigen ligase family protein, partial [Ignavibacteria bacterium]|nr:O-antigen ligase family protein [Ignavibacteria bacterium]
MLILLIIGYGRKFLISIIIVSLLSFASHINVSIRMIIQILSLAGLVYLFLDKYDLKSSSYPKIPDLVKRFLILFYFAMLVSITSSNHPADGLFLLFRVTVFFLIVYIFYSFLDSYDDINLIIKGLIIACVVISFGIYYQFISEGFNLFDFANNSQIRIAGFNSNINASAGVFAAVLPVITSLLFYKKERIDKAALGLIILFIVVALLLTNSRAAILSIIVSTIVLLFQLRRKLFLRLISGILSIILIVYFLEPLSEFLFLLLRLESGISFREYYWEIATNIIEDNFILGIGPGNYRYVMFDHYPV